LLIFQELVDARINTIPVAGNDLGKCVLIAVLEFFNKDSVDGYFLSFIGHNVLGLEMIIEGLFLCEWGFSEFTLFLSKTPFIDMSFKS
jgi:hypothetical protein